MDIDDLLNAKDKKTREYEARTGSRAQEAESARLAALHRNRASHEFSKLNEIEEGAWKCAKKYASLIVARIVPRRPTLLGLFKLSAIKTESHSGIPCHPTLSFNFWSKYSTPHVMHVDLTARGGSLLFSAKLFGHHFARVPERTANTTLDADAASLITWLEAQFVKFHHECSA